MRLPSARGFTLIELMVIIITVGLLATLTVPAYQRAMHKARRSEARTVLLEMQLRQEKWRGEHDSYGSDASALGAPASGGAAAFYRFTVSDAAASSYTVQAQAIAGRSQQHDQQNGVNCATLSINQSGERTPAACW